MANLTNHSDGRQPGPRRPNFAVLWVIVTCLWTLATVLRIQRIWVPVLGWSTVLGSVYTWVTLFLPSLMFAIILLALKRIAAARPWPGG